MGGFAAATVAHRFASVVGVAARSWAVWLGFERYFMKHLIWIALFVLAMIGVVGWGSGSGSLQYLPPAPQVHQERSVSQNPVASMSPIPDSGEVVAFPVDPTLLWRHLEALAGERYAETDRERTRQYLSQQLRSWGFSPVLQSFAEGINVVAERPGTDAKAGAILVAAHYDTVLQSPGVDDNATGVATVLEVARLLGNRPTPRTLRVAFFDREELGVLGSLAFTAREAQLKDLQGVVVLDMVGYACHEAGCQQFPEGLPAAQLLQASGIPESNQGQFIAVVGDAEHLPLLKAFPSLNSSGLPPVVTVPVPLKGLLTPDVLRSDHAPFWYQGVGAVLVTDTANLRSPHYHRPSDTLDNIDRPFFTGTAQIVVNATAQLLAGQKLTNG